MIQDKKGLTVPYSGTSLPFSHPTLSEQLTPSLISLGLVKGTTLTFGRRLCFQGIPAGVSFAQDGQSVALPKQGWLF